jgi:hypothetical protein
MVELRPRDQLDQVSPALAIKEETGVACPEPCHISYLRAEKSDAATVRNIAITIAQTTILMNFSRFRNMDSLLLSDRWLRSAQL